ncbi:MAG: hypothetical protein QOF14_3940 [Hyphomicrobiales bacterium]|jgi:hypothetical protein|nr:hypothetical protein [Hyphomicrobiales bacterium]
MSAAPEGATAAIHTSAPAPAMTQRFIVVTPVGSRNDAAQGIGRLVQKSHTIQSLGTRTVQPSGPASLATQPYGYACIAQGARVIHRARGD